MPHSRDGRVSHLQQLTPVPPKESEREYLERMQKEYIEKAKVIKSKEIDKLPDVYRIHPKPPSYQLGNPNRLSQEYNQLRPKLSRPNPGLALEKIINEEQKQAKILEPRKIIDIYSNRKPIPNLDENIVNKQRVYRGLKEDEDISSYKENIQQILNRYEHFKNRENRYLNEKNSARILSENADLLEKKADYLLKKYRSGDGISYRKDGNSNGVDLYKPESRNSERSDCRNSPLDIFDKYNNIYKVKKDLNQIVTGGRGREGAPIPYNIRDYNSQQSQEKKRYY